MKRSQRLKVIVDLNADKEKKALEELGQVQVKKQQSEIQLENLQQYQLEYLQTNKETSEKSISVIQLIEFRSFISKLDKAIEDQRQVVLDMGDEVILARKNWEIQHHKMKGMQKIRDSAIAEEVKIENKREQNEQDDRAARIGRNSGTVNV